ncbi:AAA family ATPase [uncultured Psychroserpens sp.]|uniref:AAA family ATPase n=1 Tax=uncultured Psychroserpens sp. TaxID=255436 RepID=UPI00263466C0|nr:AAA family ATPase [uncultured Psychroserpens sp.]
MKVLIFGASGSGTTTLGNEIERQIAFKHLDVDHYYWKNTEPPFQEKIPLDERNQNLKADFKTFENVVVSGSMVSWGIEWQTAFDIVVFITLDNEKRMERLKNREAERYGKRLITNKSIKQNSEAFLEWANQYENPNFEGRSLKIHNNWIKQLNCKIMRIDGEIELIYKTTEVINAIKNHKPHCR